ncbi:MAG: SPW repeat protein [Acidobacteriaceae bacterium]|nr:SPW repeat protein [Acidobacteriaceae bacterium]
MTPQEQRETSARVAASVDPNLNARLGGIRAASTICLLAGIWFFVSPWVYGAAANGNAWNSWIVGAAMFLIGLLRLWRPAYSAGFSWVNLVLGIWAFCSPWIYGYTANTGRFINSLCVGVIVFACALSSGVAATRIHRMPGARP